MNWYQKKKYSKMFTRWSDCIYSIDFKKIPKYAYEGEKPIDQESLQVMTCCRAKNGCIVLNEGSPCWTSERDILLALDRLPHSLLVDIYQMEARRYGDSELKLQESDSPGEKVRKAMFLKLIPALISAHRESKIPHL